MDMVVEEIAETEVSLPNSSSAKIVELSPHILEQEELEDEVEEKYNPGKWPPGPSKHRKSYSPAWERNVDFRDWVGRHHNDSSRAMCRYCNCSLRAHKTDLKKHMTSNKHRKNQRVYERVGGVRRTPGYGAQSVLLKREPNSELENISYNLIDDALMHIDGTFMNDDQDDYSVTDGEIKATVNKVGEAFCRDLLRLLRRQKPLVRNLQRSDLGRGEKGIDQMTRLLVAHLAQHYLVESTFGPWRGRRGGTMADSMAEKLAHIEDQMEKYVLEIRNMKLQLESESGRGPAGVTLDTLDLSDLQKTSATINIVGN